MGQRLMRARCARLLHRLAAKIEPPFTFSPDVMAVIERHNLRADELGPGFEIGHKWAKQLTTGANSVINRSAYTTLGLPKMLSSKMALDRLGRALSAEPRDSADGK